MIHINTRPINWNIISNWVDAGNTITSQSNNPLCVVQSDMFSLNISLSPNVFFLSFDVDGYIPNLSLLNIELIFPPQIGTVNWEIRKRYPKTSNTRAYSSQKLKLRKAWFNNSTQMVSLRITFQNAGNTSVSLSNIRIDDGTVIPIQPVIVQPNAMVAAARTTNGTGTSGPNGPR